jgi:hypothetical protein
MTRTFIASAALAAALSFSGFAYAQTMVNGMAVSADDLPKVQSQCDTLARVAMSEPLASDADETASVQSDSPTQPSGVDQATTSFNLATLTLESCKEAGLIK